MTRQLAVLFFLTAGISLAQQTGISGRVTDPSAASIDAAVVTATADDGARIKTISNSQGLYQFPALRAAKYVIRFEAPGFTPAERTISLLVGQVATIDIAMQLATASASVAVEAAAPAVDASTSSIAGDVSPTEVA